MNEAELTETLDRRGQLDDARGPGCYALKVDTPDAADTVARHWHRHHDEAPSEGFYARVAGADTVLYVGASGHVYDRLCDHVASDVRVAAFLTVFDVAGLHSLWPYEGTDEAFRHEDTVARELTGPLTRVWTDGVLW